MKWNVVFLVDKNPLSKVVLLKRAAGKTFAANKYTGVGGKVEKDEGLVDSAIRELIEETGIAGIKLYEFARAILNGSDSLHYFWGIYSENNLPASEDGNLEWVKKDNLTGMDFIHSTKTLVKIWQKKRNFDLNKPFTVYLTEVKTQDSVKDVKLIAVKEGLRADKE